jgi:4-hydroxy-3-polyprenylbenzoate decarboxylase
MSPKGAAPTRTYPDLHDHIAALEKAGQLITVTRPINKDTEMHPLVRWQFRGGLKESERRAFLFTNVVDSKGKRYDIPVVVGVLAANREIYRIGLGCELDKIEQTWARATAAPIPPRVVENAPCHEIVITGDDLNKPGMGWTAFPCRFQRRAGTTRPTRRCRNTSPGIPRPACRTWATTAAK